MLIKIGPKEPKIHADSFVAENATLTGEVTIGPGSSVWYGAVLRGDYAAIEVGAGSNIQDNCVLHVVNGKPVLVGDRVTVGHGAILHGCKIGSGTIVGMGAVILDGAEIGEGCLIGAGALVPPGKIIPPRSLAMGSPAKITKEFSGEEAGRLQGNATAYERLWRDMYK
ncbi:MAG: gamma carbonic anhydrase family protein [bacterium]|jgi:carbonic anhydrase/acetyltransferase-like protein (isoleucine patch superfamily)